MIRSNKRTAVIWTLLLLLVLAVSCVGLTANAEEIEPISGSQLVEPEAGEVLELQSVEEEPPAEAAQPTATPAIKNTPAASPEPTTQHSGSVPQATPPAYTVRFLNTDGTVFGSVLLQEGTPIERPETDPGLEGYVFAYWYDVKAGEETPFAFGTGVAEDVTLRAFFIMEDVLEGDGLPGDDGQGDDNAAGYLDTVVVDGEDNDEDLFGIADEEASPAEPQLSVTITSDAGEFAEHGDVITLTAQTTGLEGLEYTAVWQYFDGIDWHEAESGAGLVYQYTFAQENEGWCWRLEIVVRMNEELTEQDDNAVVL